MATRTTPTPVARAVLRTQSDERLVKLSREGGERAFEEIVRRYRPGLVAFARAYAPSDRAEDVVQESLLKSWDALRDSSAEIRLKPWLYTIVRNRALNARRDSKPHEPLDETIDGVRQPADIVLEKQELERVVAAVNALPPTQREALVRSAVEGHAHEQIAAALATSTGAVRQLIYRARMTLRHACGLLVPLPVLAALAAGGSGSAAGGAAALAGAAGGAGGGSLALKGAAAVAIGALAVGGGVAIERSQRHDDRATDSQRASPQAAGNAAERDELVAAGSTATSSGAGQGEEEQGEQPSPGGDQDGGAIGGGATSGDSGGGSAQSGHGGGSSDQGSDDDGGGPGHGPGPGDSDDFESDQGAPTEHGDDHDHGELDESGHEASVEGFEDDSPEHEDLELEESSGPGSGDQDSGADEPDPDEPEAPLAD